MSSTNYGAVWWASDRMITLKCILLTQYRLKLPFLSFIYAVTGGPHGYAPRWCNTSCATWNVWLVNWLCHQQNTELYGWASDRIIMTCICLTRYRCKGSYIRASTHRYKRTHANPTPMSTFERVGQHRCLIVEWASIGASYDLEILRSHHRCLVVEWNVSSHWTYIAGKYWN